MKPFICWIVQEKRFEPLDNTYFVCNTKTYNNHDAANQDFLDRKQLDPKNTIFLFKREDNSLVELATRKGYLAMA